MGSKVKSYTSQVEFSRTSSETKSKKSKHKKSKSVVSGSFKSSYSPKGTKAPYYLTVEQTDNKIVAVCTSSLHPKKELKITEKHGKQKIEKIDLKKLTRLVAIQVLLKRVFI